MTNWILTFLIKRFLGAKAAAIAPEIISVVTGAVQVWKKLKEDGKSDAEAKDTVGRIINPIQPMTPKDEQIWMERNDRY